MKGDDSFLGPGFLQKLWDGSFHGISALVPPCGRFKAKKIHDKQNIKFLIKDRINIIDFYFFLPQAPILLGTDPTWILNFDILFIMEILQ